MKYKDKSIYFNSSLIEILSETNVFEELNIYTYITIKMIIFHVLIN